MLDVGYNCKLEILDAVLYIIIHFLQLFVCFAIYVCIYDHNFIFNIIGLYCTILSLIVLVDYNVCLVIWCWEPQPHSPSKQQQCYSIPGPSPQKKSAVMQRQPAGLCLCQLGVIQNYVLCNFTLILYKNALLNVSVSTHPSASLS